MILISEIKYVLKQLLFRERFHEFEVTEAIEKKKKKKSNAPGASFKDYETMLLILMKSFQTTNS